MSYKNFYADAEYIQKEQDPSSDNQYIYNYGHAAIFNLRLLAHQGKLMKK